MDKSKMNSSFRGIWYGLSFLSPFFFSPSLLSICKRSSLAKIWEGVAASKKKKEKTPKDLKDIPQDALLVTADVVRLYPSIPREARLKALKEALDKRENRNIATMAS